jgi:hypothetical protein
MPVDEETRAEIRAAAAAIRRDRSFRREDVKGVLSEYLDPKPVADDDTPPAPPPKEGDPPEDDKPPEDEPPKKTGAWWGSAYQ